MDKPTKGIKGRDWELSSSLSSPCGTSTRWTSNKIYKINTNGTSAMQSNGYKCRSLWLWKFSLSLSLSHLLSVSAHYWCMIAPTHSSPSLTFPAALVSLHIPTLTTLTFLQSLCQYTCFILRPCHWFHDRAMTHLNELPNTSWRGWLGPQSSNISREPVCELNPQFFSCHVTFNVRKFLWAL
jgi:hypothetical protein